MVSTSARIIRGKGFDVRCVHIPKDRRDQPAKWTVGIALDLLQFARDETVGVITLVSCDPGLAPAIKRALKEGSPIVVVGIESEMPPSLRHAASAFIALTQLCKLGE